MAEDFIRLIPKSIGVKQQLTQRHDDCIIFRHGHIAITNYKKGDNFEFEKSLSVWDKISFKYRLVGGYYVKALHEFRINRGYDVKMLRRFFPKHNIIVDNDAYPADKIDVDLYAEPRSDFQKVALTFMAGQGAYKGYSKYTQQMIDADTGDGKTYCGTAASALMSSRVVIIVPFSKLLEQWKESFVKFTSIEEDEILIVQGSKTCKKIADGKCKDIKVFIFMVDTLYSYQKTYGDIAVIDMLASTKAYIKIVDEIHRDMKAISMIEALSNFRMNYYMSASPGRAEQKENWIFKTLFHNVPKFGSNFKTQEEKHINVMIKKYHFLPDPRQVNRMVNNKVGMNTKAYERELINSYPEQRESFDNALKVMLNWSKGLIVKDNKVLILAQTIDFLNYMKDIAEEVYPGECALYYGGLSKSEKADALKCRVVIATSSSLGTGADIKGLQFVFNCGTYSNWLDATQLPGRARKLDDPSVEVVYCELVNFSYRKTVKQFEHRKPYLINKSKTGKLIIVN